MTFSKTVKETNPSISLSYQGDVRKDARVQKNKNPSNQNNGFFHSAKFTTGFLCTETNVKSRKLSKNTPIHPPRRRKGRRLGWSPKVSRIRQYSQRKTDALLRTFHFIYVLIRPIPCVIALVNTVAASIFPRIIQFVNIRNRILSERSSLLSDPPPPNLSPLLSPHHFPFQRGFYSRILSKQRSFLPSDTIKIPPRTGTATPNPYRPASQSSADIESIQICLRTNRTIHCGR